VLASSRAIPGGSARSCRTAGIQRWGRGYEAVDGLGGRRVGLYHRQQRKRPHLKRELLSALKRASLMVLERVVSRTTRHALPA
jgi:hypothetical protein